MIEILALVIMAGVFIYYLYLTHQERKQWQEERRKLLDRIQARNLHEFKLTEKLDKPKPKKEEKKEVHRLI